MKLASCVFPTIRVHQQKLQVRRGFIKDKVSPIQQMIAGRIPVSVERNRTLQSYPGLGTTFFNNENIPYLQTRSSKFRRKAKSHQNLCGKIEIQSMFTLALNLLNRYRCGRCGSYRQAATTMASTIRGATRSDHASPTNECDANEEISSNVTPAYAHSRKRRVFGYASVAAARSFPAPSK
jgi:hypothetical protein